MLDCLIIGDSIANGIKNSWHDCAAITEPGINSRNYYRKYHDRPLLDMEEYQFTVISLGTNDTGDEGAASLQRLRKKIHTGRVIWILPNDEVRPVQLKMVERIAAEHGDFVFSIKNYVGKDRIHPPTVAAYERIVKDLKESK